MILADAVGKGGVVVVVVLVVDKEALSSCAVIGGVRKSTIYMRVRRSQSADQRTAGWCALADYVCFRESRVVVMST